MLLRGSDHLAVQRWQKSNHTRANDWFLNLKNTNVSTLKTAAVAEDSPGVIPLYPQQLKLTTFAYLCYFVLCFTLHIGLCCCLSFTSLASFPCDNVLLWELLVSLQWRVGFVWLWSSTINSLLLTFIKCCAFKWVIFKTNVSLTGTDLTANKMLSPMPLYLCFMKTDCFLATESRCRESSQVNFDQVLNRCNILYPRFFGFNQRESSCLSAVCCWLADLK